MSGHHLLIPRAVKYLSQKHTTLLFQTNSLLLGLIPLFLAYTLGFNPIPHFSLKFSHQFKSHILFSL